MDQQQQIDHLEHVAQERELRNWSEVGDETPILICADCLVWHANGDLSGLDLLPPEEAARREEAVRMGPGDGMVIITEEGEGEFSWSPCDTCGDHLGGQRYSALLVERC